MPGLNPAVRFQTGNDNGVPIQRTIGEYISHVN